MVDTGPEICTWDVQCTVAFYAGAFDVLVTVVSQTFYWTLVLATPVVLFCYAVKFAAILVFVFVDLCEQWRDKRRAKRDAADTAAIVAKSRKCFGVAEDADIKPDNAPRLK